MSVMNNWMMKCEEVTKLVSQSLDRRLPLHQRIGIRLHLMMCVHCRRFRRQIEAIGHAARSRGGEVAGATAPAGMERRIVDRLVSTEDTGGGRRE